MLNLQDINLLSKIMNVFPEHEVEELVLEETVDTNETHELIVFNDDVNTFEHVISTLINVCEHTQEQAEQCTWIIHYKGKCSVKVGDVNKLKPLRQKICDKGISAEVY